MTHRASRRLEVDGARALAILAVIANHVAPDVAPSGYLGVDLFFVISGFLITLLILRDLDLLQELASRNLVSVAFSLTTLDDELKRIIKESEIFQ